jgi:hypothetical protein
VTLAERKRHGACIEKGSSQPRGSNEESQYYTMTRLLWAPPQVIAEIQDAFLHNDGVGGALAHCCSAPHPTRSAHDRFYRGANLHNGRAGLHLARSESHFSTMTDSVTSLAGDPHSAFRIGPFAKRPVHAAKSRRNLTQ